MKTILFAILLYIGLPANAQMIKPEKVPAAVKSAFSKKHPTTHRITWELEKGNYEAGFTIDGVANSELYNRDGMMLESEREINQSLLPRAVLTYVKNHYNGVKIKEAAKIVDSKGVVKYEAAIRGIDLIFDSNGRFLQEVKD